MTLKLSNDQELALRKLNVHFQTHNEGVLTGAAGTGKTTTLKAYLEQCPYRVMFLAPTGKAALRVTEQTQQPCQTCHSALFTQVDESEGTDGSEILHFSEPSPPEGCHRGVLVVIDESSMIDEDLAKDLREQIIGIAQAKILWVGDREQLPPVSGRWGADLQHPTSELTTVHRQAGGSPILDLATKIRTSKHSEFDGWKQGECEKHKTKVNAAVSWLCSGGDRAAVTFTNKTRKLVNFLYRRRKKYAEDRITEGETLLITMNNHGANLMNGETIVVTGVSDQPLLSNVFRSLVQRVFYTRRYIRGGQTMEITESFLCFPEIFDQDSKEKSSNKLIREKLGRWYNNEVFDEIRSDTGLDSLQLEILRERHKREFVQCTWGYCLTVHKSQGSQWDHIAFISCGFFRKTLTSDVDFGRRLYYTAVTRAAKTYTEFECGYIPSVEDTRKQMGSMKGSTRDKFLYVLKNGGDFSITSSRTGAEFHYRIDVVEKGQWTNTFVKFINSEGESVYLGAIKKTGFTRTRASAMEASDTPLVTFNWMYTEANKNFKKLEKSVKFSFTE